MATSGSTVYACAPDTVTALKKCENSSSENAQLCYCDTSALCNDITKCVCNTGDNYTPYANIAKNTEWAEAENGAPEAENGAPEAENGNPETENGTPEAENGAPEAENGNHEAENGAPEAENGSPEAENSVPSARTSPPSSAPSALSASCYSVGFGTLWAFILLRV